MLWALPLGPEALLAGGGGTGFGASLFPARLGLREADLRHVCSEMPSLEGSFLLLRLRLRPQQEGLRGRLSSARACPRCGTCHPSPCGGRSLAPGLLQPRPLGGGGPRGAPAEETGLGGRAGAWGRGWAWLAGLLRSPGDLTCLSRFFIGTSVSTFSFRIHEEREILGLDPKTTYNRFCGDEEKACEQPTHWRIAY